MYMLPQAGPDGAWAGQVEPRHLAHGSGRHMARHMDTHVAILANAQAFVGFERHVVYLVLDTPSGRIQNQACTVSSYLRSRLLLDYWTSEHESGHRERM